MGRRTNAHLHVPGIDHTWLAYYHDGIHGEWDAHSDLAGNHLAHCAATDVPIHGLLTDLERQGLLDSTLVIWGGEFGRMPVSQGNNGRDYPHNGRWYRLTDVAGNLLTRILA